MHRPRRWSVLVPLDLDDPGAGPSPPGAGELLCSLRHRDVIRLSPDDTVGCGVVAVTGLQVGFQAQGGPPPFGQPEGPIAVGLSWESVQGITFPFARTATRKLADSRFFAYGSAAPIPGTQTQVFAPSPYQGDVNFYEPWPITRTLQVYYLGCDYQAGITYGYARIHLMGPCTAPSEDSDGKDGI